MEKSLFVGNDLYTQSLWKAWVFSFFPFSLKFLDDVTWSEHIKTQSAELNDSVLHFKPQLMLWNS